ncbi:metal-dependent phosphohydrolase [Streptomyces sp. NPDC046939]|uniref:metal-dependent phosphohydrolase n=1 Tax=Streptomyces sp. NPDC046939 TaxID=3155376 RepID=UPI0033E48949
MDRVERVELRTVEELMAVLHACRGAWGAPGRGGARVDLHDHALQTAALLRRGRPSDKELQVAGLVHALGPLLDPGGDVGVANAVRGLLGERVARLVRLNEAARRYVAALEPVRGLPARGAMPAHEIAAFASDPLAEDALALRQAADAAWVAGMDAGVMEDWRPVLELVAARRTTAVRR